MMSNVVLRELNKFSILKCIPKLFSFGYCGKGEEFCESSSISDIKAVTNERQRKTRQGTKDKTTRTTSSKSGAGCVLEDVEWVGGDLPPIVGGGGVRLDKNTSEECFTRYIW